MDLLLLQETRETLQKHWRRRVRVRGHGSAEVSALKAMGQQKPLALHHVQAACSYLRAHFPNHPADLLRAVLTPLLPQNFPASVLPLYDSSPEEVAPLPPLPTPLADAYERWLDEGAHVRALLSPFNASPRVCLLAARVYVRAIESLSVGVWRSAGYFQRLFRLSPAERGLVFDLLRDAGLALAPPLVPGERNHSPLLLFSPEGAPLAGVGLVRRTSGLEVPSPFVSLLDFARRNLEEWLALDPRSPRDFDSLDCLSWEELTVESRLTPDERGRHVLV